MMDYALGNSQKIGGPDKTVEIHVRNFYQQMYNRGHKVKAQWVFGGVEREYEKDISSSPSVQNRRHVDGCSS